ncbi:MAG: hypothetical protein ACJ8C4_07085 [Gemmataceae bacterium]
MSSKASKNQNSEPSFDDLNTFLDVYEAAKADSDNKLTTLQELFRQPSVNLSTVNGRMERVILYFLGRPNGKKRGPGFERLFTRISLAEDQEPPQRIGLKPTRIANHLAKQVRMIKGCFRSARNSARSLLSPEPKPVLKLATQLTLGSRFLTAVLSNLDAILGKSARLEWSIGNTMDQIPLLELGVLDVVFGFGPANEHHYKHPKSIVFTSFNYESSMVLLSHPNCEIWTTKKKDINLNYWENDFRPLEQTASRASLRFDKLRGVVINEIDFNRTAVPLVVSSSFNQPPSLVKEIERLRIIDHIREVDTYEEGLALARLGLGLTVAIEVFALRRRTSVFKIQPASENSRWLGVYWNERKSMSDTGVRLVAFLQEYIKRFEREIRSGNPPALEERSYTKLCNEHAVSAEKEGWIQSQRAAFQLPSPKGSE